MGNFRLGIKVKCFSHFQKYGNLKREEALDIAKGMAKVMNEGKEVVEFEIESDTSTIYEVYPREQIENIYVESMDDADDEAD